MTLKNTTKIALLFSIMVLPLVGSSAYADGTAEIIQVCGFTTPSDIPLGLIIYGEDSDEVNFSIDVEGNAVGTLDLTASDWISVENQGNQATAELTIMSNIVLDSYVVIQGVSFTAKENPTGFQEFDYSEGYMPDMTTSLAEKINAHPSLNVLVSANEPTWTIIVLTAVEHGTVGNALGITSSAGIGISGTNFTGGTDEYPTILPADTTRFHVTDDGSSSTGTTYLQKGELANAGSPVILTQNASNDYPINLSFQLTGVDVLDDVDYIGAIQQSWTFTYSCTE